MTIQRAHQDPATVATLALIERFNEVFNTHDVNAIMALFTDDCVFENTQPAPDGKRYVGQAEVRGYWERLFSQSPKAHFTTEDIFAAGDRCAVRWRYDWVDDKGKPGHVRGVDVFRVHNGKVAEKCSYVKG
jgi:ketosteroid isomerase-like protein